MKTFYTYIFLLAIVIGKSLNAQEVTFIQNKGQWSSQVLFKADVPGGNLFITTKGLVYNFYDAEAIHKNQHNLGNLPVNAHAIFVNFDNANANPKVITNVPSQTLYNYFLGNDKQKWASGARGYNKVVLKNIYNHVDFEIVGVNGGVKTAFIVHNSQSWQNIKVSYHGADSVFLDNQHLVIKHSLGVMKELPPVSFITNQGLTQNLYSAYVLQNNILSYQVAMPKSFTSTDSLIIDPSVVFSTFSGSVADNFGFTATFDAAGNAYAGGTVYSIGFPVTEGAYQLTFSGGSSSNNQSARDVGILKFSDNGKQLLYATYIGGSHNEQPHSMSCDNNGNLYVMGTTKSSNFPSKNGYDNSHNGNYDLFVTCLNPQGTDILYSTFIGSDANDGFNGLEDPSYQPNAPNTYNFGDFYRGDIRLDKNNNVYIATVTQSDKNMPMVNASQNTFGGGLQDAWVLKLTPQLNTILLSSYLGGAGADAAFSVRILDDYFYIAGGSNSANLALNSPLTFKGNVDGFVAKYNQTNNYARQATAYIGTVAYDQIYFVSTDLRNQVYVTGQTAGVFNKIGNVYHETAGKQFISVLDVNLTTITAQSAFGGGVTYPKLSPSAFMVDKCERVYLSGWGGNSNRQYNNNTSFTTGLPTTPDAFQRSSDGSDFYMVIFNRNLSGIGYASYFGGPQSAEHVDGGTSHFDENGVVYQSVCAGCGGFSDFPTTDGAYSRQNKGKRPNGFEGGCNNAIFKFNARPSPMPPVMRDTIININATDTVLFRFNITDENGDSIIVTSLSGNMLSISPNAPMLITLSNQPGLIRNEFRWFSRCENGPDTFKLTVKLRDVACENLQFSEGTITIIVAAPVTQTVDLNCLKQINDNNVEVSWQHQNTKYHSRINILQSINSGAYDSVGFIPNTFTAKKITQTLANLSTINYCYRLVAVNSCNMKGGVSREACTLESDTFFPGAYNFTRDSTLYIAANEQLQAEIKILDNEFADSLFVNYAGSFLTANGTSVGYTNGVGSAQINFSIKPTCSMVGDTFDLAFGVKDNKCPKPIKDNGIWKIVVTPALPARSQSLPCLRNLGNNKIGIHWQQAPNNPRLTKYALIKISANNNIINLGDFPTSQTNIVEQIALDPFNQKHCFALVAFNVCNVATDTGEYSCTPWPDSLYPEPLMPHYVTVFQNKAIEIAWPNSSSALFNQLYRMDYGLQNKTIIQTFNTPSDSLFVDEDKAVNVHKANYCYVVETTNQCGLKAKQSPHACSILLQGKTEPFAHHLNWNEYLYFANSTSHYQLTGRDLTQTNFEHKTTVVNKNTFYTDTKLNKETGIFYYQAKAFENNSAYISQSNIVELKQKPLLHVPNAYTPNNDGLNDTWNIVPVFVKDYHLKVYDRWGRLVFETQDKHKQLTATDLDNVTLACDAFAYVVTYTGFVSNQVFTKTGNVTILK